MTPGTGKGRTPRSDGVAKVTGAGRFTVDVALPGMLAARLVRSPFPHARIRHIDAAGTAGVPGAVAVFTAQDIPPALQHAGPLADPPRPRSPLLAIDRVRYVGEPVAAVVAANEEAAREMAALVDVDYDPLPAIGTIEAALQAEAPLIHDGGNIAGSHEATAGDPETAFRDAASVVEGEYLFPALSHYTLEPHVVLVSPSGSPGERRLEVWTSSRNVYGVRQVLAGWAGLPESAVRVHLPFVGGAYGSKSYVYIEPLTAWLALRLFRPVKLELSLAEGFLTSSGHRVKVHIRTALDENHLIRGRLIRLWVDMGAYPDRGLSGDSISRSLGYRSVGPYRIPNVRVEATALHTNRVPAGALRGYGTPQVIWAYESHMNAIARRIGEDPVAFRRRHLLRPGESYPLGGHPIDTNLEAAIEEMQALLPRSASERSPDLPAYVAWGYGSALGIKDSGGNRRAALSWARLHQDGSLTVSVSAAETGQGSSHVVRQIAAETLGIPFDAVRTTPVDTLAAPFDQSTGSSATTAMTGRAVERACRELAAQLLRAAARLLGEPDHHLRLEGGRVVGKNGAASIPEVIASTAGSTPTELLAIGEMIRSPDTTREALYWESSVASACVAVDLETGEVRVAAYATVSDVGKALNPAAVTGQEEGAAVMGLGHTLFEDLGDDEYVLRANPIDYRVPTFSTLPGRLVTASLERGDGPGPMGSKGVGESGILAVAPTVGAAIADATGIEETVLPLTPERIVRRPGTPRQSP